MALEYCGCYLVYWGFVLAAAGWLKEKLSTIHSPRSNDYNRLSELV